MMSRERIIDGLNRAKEYLDSIARKTMPGNGLLEVSYLSRAAEDAKTLLTPRVIPRALLLSDARPFAAWYEERKTGELFPMACIDGKYTNHDVTFIVQVEIITKAWKDEWNMYRETWRMWTEKPTDEQRNAEPWRGTEEK